MLLSVCKMYLPVCNNVKIKMVLWQFLWRCRDLIYQIFLREAFDTSNAYIALCPQRLSENPIIRKSMLLFYIYQFYIKAQHAVGWNVRA
jgi:hypothetical protein